MDVDDIIILLKKDKQSFEVGLSNYLYYSVDGRKENRIESKIEYIDYLLKKIEVD